MAGNTIIVGGGLAGLMAAIKIAENGQKVDLFSLVPCKRSHSVCAQGGINAAVNTKGEGDSTWEHSISWGEPAGSELSYLRNIWRRGGGAKSSGVC